MRKLPTEGTKAVLLERLQKDLPYVTLDIDSRECLQRVVNSMLYHFGWENDHLFECQLPARGDLKEGTGTNKQWLQYLDHDIGLLRNFQYDSANTNKYKEQTRLKIQKKLDQFGLTWADIARAKREPEATGPWRKLTGSGFAHDTKGPCDDWNEDFTDGGWFSLGELALAKGDNIRMKYDLGDENNFIIHVTEIKQNAQVLPEVNLYGHQTRMNLAKKGSSKMRNQYNDGSAPY